jgi:hypothetical protein
VKLKVEKAVFAGNLYSGRKIKSMEPGNKRANTRLRR